MGTQIGVRQVTLYFEEIACAFQIRICIEICDPVCFQRFMQQCYLPLRFVDFPLIRIDLRPCRQHNLIQLHFPLQILLQNGKKTMHDLRMQVFPLVIFTLFLLRL